jgi:hypothetical protein
MEKSYDKPGSYIETLKVKDRAGNVAYDFTSINVLDPKDPTADPLTIHAVYWPSESVQAGQELTFKVRTFGSTEGEEHWEFGDGLTGTSKSDGNQRMHAKDGYAIVKHTYARPGDYIVRVWRGNAETRLWVPVR